MKDSDSLLIKLNSSAERNQKILDLIFDIEANKIEVVNTFDKNELNADNKNNHPIFIDFKKLSTINLDTDFLWNLYKYKSSKKSDHENMKYSYFLWCEKSEKVFMDLLKLEIKSNTRVPFLLIMNSLLFSYDFKSYKKFFKENKTQFYNILKYYLNNDKSLSFSMKNETLIPKKNKSLFAKNNIEYINQALNVYLINLI